ncbi:HlyD family type I secretion periplasmic adaptor subunit [Brevundimonas sp. VNH65]|uniref:HlyD family type I secretion periplasmic adaptor subunit n=1 Tax=Brevundimonas sp. VNH65 TaxID=3400917 RepID=UPI003C0FB8AC
MIHASEKRSPGDLADIGRFETDSPRREQLLGVAIAVVFFIVFLGWAAFAPLDAGAYATGQVVVSGNRQAVQHREGGVVRALSVAEGDRVVRGQLLLDLNVGDLEAAERGLSAQVIALLAQRARLIAERDGTTITPPREFADLQDRDRALADEAMVIQHRQFSARGVGRSTEAGVLEQRVSQLRDQMDGYDRQIDANIEQQRLLVEELQGLRDLAAKGFAPQNRVRALERTAAALKGEEGALRAQVARAQEQIGETRLQRTGVSTRMQEDVTEQLRQVEVQLNELRPRLIDLQRQIERARIRSPASGQVVGLAVFTPGGVIQPGQTLMEVVPDNAAQVVSVHVDPADIDNLRIGQRTEVKFPGLREFNPPVVQGRVSRISADSFKDDQTGRTHFSVEVVVPPEQMAGLGASGATLRPGVPVEVVILTRKRTALTYLIEPLTRSLWRSGAEQ